MTTEPKSQTPACIYCQACPEKSNETTLTDARANRQCQMDTTPIPAQNGVQEQMENQATTQATVWLSDIEKNEYKMDCDNMGRALIINNITFVNAELGDRRGSDKDAAALYQTFDTLGFETDILINASYDEINIKMKEIADYDHSENSCFVCAVLSHGDKEGVWATDRQLEVQELMDSVNSQKCPSLIFKPKIFIVQACRGNSLDSGMELSVMEDRIVSDSAGDYTEYMMAPPAPIPHNIRVPNDMDFLVLYSSIAGKGAFRNTEHGSPFINYLVEALETMEDREDFYQVLTRLNKKMAVEFTPHGSNPDFRLMKQMPCFLSMLTKTLRFKKRQC